MTRLGRRWLMQIPFAICLSVTDPPTAVTLPELASRVESTNRSEREALLIKGAREEKEVLFYGTTPVAQVAVLRKSFNARYPFVELKHFYGVRQVILNKAMSEFRSGGHLADVLMTDVSYGWLQTALRLHTGALPQFPSAQFRILPETVNRNVPEFNRSH